MADNDGQAQRAARPKMKTSTIVIIGGVAAVGGYFLIEYFRNKAAAGSSGGGSQYGPPRGSHGVSLAELLAILRGWQGHHHPNPGGPEQGGDGDGGTRQIVITRTMTVGELARSRHWTAETLQDVLAMNLTQGGGHWTESTVLHKGDTVLRPWGAQ